MLNVKKTLTKLMTREDSSATVTKGTAGNKWCRKCGNLVEFYIEITNISWASGWNALATLPSGYEPKEYYDFAGIDQNNDIAVHCKVSALGVISVFKASGMSANVRLHSLHFAKTS